jgi:hypothetical protein
MSASAAAPVAAEGEPTTTPARPRFELTPYAAYRFGGELESAADDTGATRDFDLRDSRAYGLILDIRTDAVNAQWEVLYARQATEIETQTTFAGGPLLQIDVDYLQFGGTYLFDDNSDSTIPFIALTAGIARLDPDVNGMEAETYLSGSIGGGVQLRANRRVGVRLEARAFGSLVDSDSDLFCLTGPEANVCALAVDGTALFQLEARAGVVFRF